ncbi:sigma-70 family RNA polymerase sigma factor [Oligoflexia bacterium]|nr:sigma-70 family RNA polymerase sigma factor [Oligoflexia bacterium]
MVQRVEVDQPPKDSGVVGTDSLAKMSGPRFNGDLLGIYMRDLHRRPPLEEDRALHHSRIVRAAHQAFDHALVRTPYFLEVLTAGVERSLRTKNNLRLYPPEFVAGLQRGVTEAKTAFTRLMEGGEVEAGNFSRILATTAELVIAREVELIGDGGKNSKRRNYGIGQAKREAWKVMQKLGSELQSQLPIFAEYVGEQRVSALIRSLVLTPESEVERVLRRKRSFDTDEIVLECAHKIRAAVLTARLEPERILALKEAFDATISGAAAESARLLVQSNLGLVVKIAGVLGDRWGVPQADRVALNGLGALGLYDAVNRFDPDRGIKFSTFAYHWIRKNITDGYWAEAKAVKVARKTRATWRKIGEAAVDFFGREGWRPTLEELAEITGIDSKTLDRHLQAAASRTFSLDKVLSTSDKDFSAQSFLESSVPEPDALLIDHENVVRMHRALSTLGMRAQEIVKLRWGLGMQRPYTLSEVGVLFKISPERVRQIQEKAQLEIIERM